MRFPANRFAWLLVVGVSATGLAVSPTSERALTADSAEQFELQSAAVRAQMKTGGRYEFVTSEERATVEKRLDEIAAIVARHADPNAFTSEEKAAMLVAQEDANAILTKNDGRRLVCERRAPTGSHLGQDRCRTVADIERERRETRKNVGDRQKQPSMSSGLPNKQGD